MVDPCENCIVKMVCEDFCPKFIKYINSIDFTILTCEEGTIFFKNRNTVKKINNCFLTQKIKADKYDDIINTRLKWLLKNSTNRKIYEV